jgi:hypothetical protein
MQETSVLDIEADELLAALNDETKAEQLMAARGWTTEDLVARAEELNRALVKSMASVNIV